MTHQELLQALIDAVEAKGQPRELGAMIAAHLGTEKTMTRMLAYLQKAGSLSAEEMADEMLAIKAEFEGYKQKKILEYYNKKNNQMMNAGPLDPDSDGS